MSFLPQDLSGKHRIKAQTLLPKMRIQSSYKKISRPQTDNIMDIYLDMHEACIPHICNYHYCKREAASHEGSYFSFTFVMAIFQIELGRTLLQLMQKIQSVI